ncbi:MAG TPA: hypothetical protein VGS07_16250 [Thermoanaerobaculia bacterium]|nr:hypothetical protein [Thermoanaerobaculia bacterium]
MESDRIFFNRLLKGIDSVQDFRSKTELELKRLKDKIKSTCASDLFADPNDPDLADAVECLPIRALWYFYERVLINKGEWLYEPFELEYQSGIFQGDDFHSLLIELGKKDKKFLPSCVFAEMDTKDTNIRIVVIPSDRLGRFYRARVKYERTGGSSSRGFLKHVIGNLPKEYNIWRTFNHIAKNTPQQELGSINLYFEDTSPGEIEPKRCFEHAQAVFSSLQHCPMPQNLADLRIVDARVGAIDTNYIKSKIQRERGKSEYDVFLSYAFKDGTIAGQIRDALELRGITEVPGLQVHYTSGQPTGRAAGLIRRTRGGRRLAGLIRQPSPRNPAQKKSRVWIKRAETAEHLYGLCRSEGRKAKDEIIRLKQEKRLLADLARLRKRIEAAGFNAAKRFVKPWVGSRSAIRVWPAIGRWTTTRTNRS